MRYICALCKRQEYLPEIAPVPHCIPCGRKFEQDWKMIPWHPDVQAPDRKDLVPYKELDVKDCCYYVIWVSSRDGNPTWRAILYTGFEGGGYRQLFDHSITLPHHIDDRHRFQIVGELKALNREYIHGGCN